MSKKRRTHKPAALKVPAKCPETIYATCEGEGEDSFRNTFDDPAELATREWQNYAIYKRVGVARVRTNTEIQIEP